MAEKALFNFSGSSQQALLEQNTGMTYAINVIKKYPKDVINERLKFEALMGHFDFVKGTGKRYCKKHL